MKAPAVQLLAMAILACNTAPAAAVRPRLRIRTLEAAQEETDARLQKVGMAGAWWAGVQCSKAMWGRAATDASAWRVLHTSCLAAPSPSGPALLIAWSTRGCEAQLAQQSRWQQDAALPHPPTAIGQLACSPAACFPRPSLCALQLEDALAAAEKTISDLTTALAAKADKTQLPDLTSYVLQSTLQQARRPCRPTACGP